MYARGYSSPVIIRGVSGENQNEREDQFRAEGLSGVDVGMKHKNTEISPVVTRRYSTIHKYCIRINGILPAATKLGQGNVFTGVCDSVHGGGVVVWSWGGGGLIPGGLQFFGGCLQFFGGSPIFGGLQIFGNPPPIWLMSGRYASYWNAFLSIYMRVPSSGRLFSVLICVQRDSHNRVSLVSLLTNVCQIVPALIKLSVDTVVI